MGRIDTSRLHPEQQRSLALVPAEPPVLLFLRHSLREQEDDPRANFDVPLTEEGVELARDWGALIGSRIEAAYSSRWPRCVDTARAMLDGAQVAGAVTVEEKLCEPGCFVSDMREAGGVFARLGAIEFVNRQLGEESVPGTVPAEEGVGDLLCWLRARQPAAGAINVFVTHDTILGTFVSQLTGRHSLGEEEWPWMLEGIFLWFDAGQVHWIWRAQQGARSLADYQIS